MTLLIHLFILSLVCKRHMIHFFSCVIFTCNLLLTDDSFISTCNYYMIHFSLSIFTHDSLLFASDYDTWVIFHIDFHMIHAFAKCDSDTQAIYFHLWPLRVLCFISNPILKRDSFVVTFDFYTLCLSFHLWFLHVIRSFSQAIITWFVSSPVWFVFKIHFFSWLILTKWLALFQVWLLCKIHFSHDSYARFIYFLMRISHMIHLACDSNAWFISFLRWILHMIHLSCDS